MTERVLVTGGCGFIGSHLVDRLVDGGRRVTVLDSLHPQVHPQGRPDYLNPAVEYVFGDVRDPQALDRVLAAADAVIHLAAVVGVGQSMYRIADYVEANSVGTARLLEALIERKDRVRKLLVASSMSVYGEGAYECADCGPRRGARQASALARGRWEPACDGCGAELEPQPTAESQAPEPTSVYALTKLDQEKLCLEVCRAYGIPAVALRLFNVYGPRQALSNPYTGVAAIFSSRIKAGEPPMVYEDGRQRRDFVSVYDVARAFVLALDSEEATDRVLNVASGRAISIRELAQVLIGIFGREEVLQPALLGTFRKGDVRHCFADVDAIRELGYRPEVELEAGLEELCAWAGDTQAEDHFDSAREELRSRGLG